MEMVIPMHKHNLDKGLLYYKIKWEKQTKKREKIDSIFKSQKQKRDEQDKLWLEFTAFNTIFSRDVIPEHVCPKEVLRKAESFASITISDYSLAPGNSVYYKRVSY